MRYKISKLLEEYSRQIIIKEIGVKGQLKLLSSRVVVIGCGATGSAVAELLVRAGVGFIKIVDRDFVELSNIPRSHLHVEGDADSAKPKALSCAEKLSKINSFSKVVPLITEVNQSNIGDLISDADLVIDATDNYEIRYLINDATLKLRKPWVHIGVGGWYGQVMFIKPYETACFRCLLPKPPPEVGDACNVLGVMNTLVTMVASIAVNEAIKYLVGLEVGNYLIFVDALRTQVSKFKVARNPECPSCSLGRLDFLNRREYRKTKVICGSNSIQVYPSSQVSLKFECIQDLNIEGVDIISITPHTLRARVDGYEITLFNDGRAIVIGLTDEKIALEIYESLLSKLGSLGERNEC